MTEYIISLAIVMIVASLDKQALTTAVVVSGNFVVTEICVRLFSLNDAWWLFSLTDALAAAMLTVDHWKWPATGRVGAAVAAIYCTQIIAHWAYALSEGGDPYTYWQAITVLAFLQLVAIAIGGINGGVRHYRHMRGLRGVSPLHYTAHSRTPEQKGD